MPVQGPRTSWAGEHRRYWASPLRREGGRMRMFSHRGNVTAADRARLAEQLAEIGMAIGVAERACCCPARPVVRVVMPATADRPEPVDLLLCGHHYRVGCAALLAAGAAVYDAGGTLIAGVPARRRSRARKTALAV